MSSNEYLYAKSVRGETPDEALLRGNQVAQRLEEHPDCSHVFPCQVAPGILGYLAVVKYMSHSGNQIEIASDNIGREGIDKIDGLLSDASAASVVKIYKDDGWIVAEGLLRDLSGSEITIEAVKTSIDNREGRTLLAEKTLSGELNLNVTNGLDTFSYRASHFRLIETDVIRASFLVKMNDSHTP